MTLRTSRYFYCPNGHKGEEKTSENDQPYSSQWGSVKTDGILAVGTDVRGYATYECKACGEPMFEKI